MIVDDTDPSRRPGRGRVPPLDRPALDGHPAAARQGARPRRDRGDLAATRASSTTAGSASARRSPPRPGMALENARLYEELRHQAFHDSLTGLANRALFQDRVEHAVVRRPGPEAGLVAVLFLDLDDFKTINESLGHAGGDQLLTAVAERLKACLRASDTAARLGGDEFAILLEDLRDESEATNVAQRVIDALRPPIRIGGTAAVIATSIGIAVSRAGRGRRDRAAAQRRLRDVPGQAPGQGSLRGLPAEPARGGHRAGGARGADARRRGAGRAPPPLPAGRRPGRRGDRRARGARPLGGARSRPADAGRLHRPGRGVGPHRRDRSVGPRASLPRDPGAGASASTSTG